MRCNPGWLWGLLLALIGAAPAAATPTVERTLDELPDAIAPDTELVVVAERAGAVRWGIDGWQLPPPSLRGAGAVVAGVVETRLEGPQLDGRYRAHLGPFPGARRVDLVVRHDDGSWRRARGADGAVAIRAGAQVRRRPITIGAGPLLGRSSGQDRFEELQDWELADCRGVDPADDARALGDGQDAARDLVAFYSRREAGALFLRADLLELGLGAEAGALDLVVLVDCAPGGERWLPDYAAGRLAGGGWELAVRVRDGSTVELIDSSWLPLVGHDLGASVRADLDAVEAGVTLEALLRAGWDGRRELGFWVYTLRAGDPRLADAFAEPDLADGVLDSRIAETRASPTAKYSVILHGNQAVQPLQWLEELVLNRRILTPAGNPTGYLRALDAHELFRAPLNIHVSGTLAATAEWGAPAFNARIRAFLDGRPENGSGALLGGVLAEHIMPYFENGSSAHGAEGANAASVRLNDRLLDRIYGGPPRSVFWIPERVCRGETLADVLHDAQGDATGYRFAVLDQVTHLARWYGAADAHGPRGFKPNRIGGVTCFLINDGADQWKFANTDGGLWLWTRRDLIAKALDPDQEQLTLVFDDWEAFSGRSFTSFGVGNDNPDNYETNLRWLANHPWVQVVTLEEVASWGWAPIERGAASGLPLETYDWLRHASEESYDTWYFGSPLEEAFAALRVDRVPGQPIAKPFGTIDGPGGLLHDVWADVARAPRGPLRDLAAAVFSVDAFETGWHDEDQNDYLSKTASGEYAAPDTSYDRVSGWSRALQARIGDAAVVAAAARWSAAPPAAPTAWRADVDHDGEQELLLADARAFYAFEDDGGRCVFAAVRDPATGRAQPFLGSLLNAPGGETSREREATHDGRVTRVPGLVEWWVEGAGEAYVNGAYRARMLAGGWRLESPDGRLVKTVTLQDGALTARYLLDPSLGTAWVRTGLAPATFDLFCGAPLQDRVRPDGACEVWAETAGGDTVSVALRPLAGARLEPARFGGKGPRGVPFAHQVEVTGRGSFALVVEPALR